MENKKIMDSHFHRSIMETRDEPGTLTFYFIKADAHVQLYILNIFDDNSASIIGSHDDFMHSYEFCDDVETKARNFIVSEGYHEITEEEFMRHVDELFPRWRKLKFNKKTKEMYFPEDDISE